VSRSVRFLITNAPADSVFMGPFPTYRAQTDIRPLRPFSHQDSLSILGKPVDVTWDHHHSWFSCVRHDIRREFLVGAFLVLSHCIYSSISALFFESPWNCSLEEEGSFDLERLTELPGDSKRGARSQRQSDPEVRFFPLSFHLTYTGGFKRNLSSAQCDAMHNNML